MRAFATLAVILWLAALLVACVPSVTSSPPEQRVGNGTFHY